MFFVLVLLEVVVPLTVNLLTPAACSGIEPLLVYMLLEVHYVALSQQALRLLRQ